MNEDEEEYENDPDYEDDDLSFFFLMRSGNEIPILTKKCIIESNYKFSLSRNRDPLEESRINTFVALRTDRTFVWFQPKKEAIVCLSNNGILPRHFNQAKKTKKEIMIKNCFKSISKEIDVDGIKVQSFVGQIKSTKNILTWTSGKDRKVLPKLMDGLIHTDKDYCYYNNKQSAINAIIIRALMMDRRKIPWWKSILPKSKQYTPDDYAILCQSRSDDNFSIFGILCFDKNNWVLDVPTISTTNGQEEQLFERIKLQRI